MVAVHGRPRATRRRYWLIMLTVHHLGHSQSERIVWLCEELGLDYALVRYDRRSDNRMAPPAYQALHPLGTAPIITDGDLVLGESGAICEYVIHTHGNGRLARHPGDADYADYLYWFHFANGSLQPLLLRMMSIDRLDPAGASPVAVMANARLQHILSLVGSRLARSPFLAGDELTAADIMTVFSLTTMRLFRPYERSPSITAYLQRITARPAYLQAMRKADPELLARSEPS